MADPISGAIAAVVTFFGASATTAAVIGTVGANLLIGAAVHTVGKALFGSKKKAVGSSGTQASFKADAQAGIPFLLGRTGTAGYNIFTWPSGSDNRYLNYFMLLSGGGPIQSIDNFTADKAAVTFNSGGTVTSGGKYAAKMWMTTALGVASAAALAVATDLATAGPVPEWTSAHKLSGMAAARWSLLYDADAYGSGVPQPLWVCKGVKVYDPRLDSTYPGGSGSQRWNDPTTYAWSENPYLHGLQYCLGYMSNGKRVGGVGVDIGMIDVAAFVEGANVADYNGWTVGGEITSLDPKWGALTAILQAGSGEPLKVAGKISCRVDAPRTSLATLTEVDVCGPVTMTPFKSRRDRKNSIIPRYRSEDHGWQIVDAAPVTSSAYQTADGGLRQKEVEYSLCQSAGQAAQLAAYELVNAREFSPITIQAKPVWSGYRPGDCITLTLPEMGLNGQKAVITSRQLDLTTGEVSLVLTSETDAKHAFALGQTASPPPTPGLTQPDFAAVPTPAPGQWGAAGGTLAGPGGSVPCITVTGSSADYGFALEVVVEYRLSTDTDWTLWATAPASTETITIAGLGGGQYYDVAVSYKSIYGKVGGRRLITSVLTPDGVGVASSITGQGPWATEQSPVAAVLTPGANMVFDGGMRLAGQGWYIGAPWVHGFGTDVGHYFGCGPTSGVYLGTPRIDVVPSVPYTFSYNIGGTAYSGTQVQVNWYDASDTFISQSLGSVTAAGTGYARQTATFTAPSTAAHARLYVYSGTITTGNFLIVYKVKAEYGTAATVFSDDATNGALYANGANIDQLKPQEIGANVTEARTAAAIMSQGALATLNQATWATQVTGTGKPDDYANKVLVWRQTTAPSSPGTNDIWVQVDGSGVAMSVYAWNGSSWIKGGDVTSQNTAAAFTGQTAWATEGTPVASVLRPGANLVFDGGLRLRGQSWFIGAPWTYGFGTDVGNYFGCGPTSGVYLGTDRFNVIPGASYAFSYNIGGTAYSGTQAQVNWYNSSDTLIAQDLGPVTTAGAGYARQSATFTAPTGAAYSRVVFYSGAITTGNFLIVFKIKAEYGTFATVFNDDATYGALYANGANIDQLKPQEIGANVTESRTSAAFAGQGALATLNQVTWATMVTGTGKPDDYANKVLVYRQTTAPSSPGANDIWVKVNGSGVALEIYAWDGSTWIKGGDVTANNVAAAFSGQGALATQNAVTWATQVTGSGKPTDNADVTSVNTAAAFTGQAALATQNAITSGQVIDPTQPTVPLRATAIAGDVGSVLQTATGTSYQWYYDYYTFRFYNNNASVNINQRIATGTRRFIVSAGAGVDRYFSVWYRVFNGGTPGSWNYINVVLIPGGGSGYLSLAAICDITVTANDEVQFYLSPTNATGVPYNTTHSGLETWGIVVTCSNV